MAYEDRFSEIRTALDELHRDVSKELAEESATRREAEREQRHTMRAFERERARFPRWALAVLCVIGTLAVDALIYRPWLKPDPVQVCQPASPEVKP